VPASSPKIPNYRERSALQALLHGRWSATSLHPAGPKAIALMIDKRWIESSGVSENAPTEYRITELGAAAFAAKITAPR
jgi:hypothetical protein